MPGWSFFPYISYFITVLLWRPTWRLSDVITCDLNRFRWSGRRPYVLRNGQTTYVRAPSSVSSHIHYIDQTYVVNLLFLAVESFCPYVMSSLISGLCPRTTCAFSPFLPSSLRCGDNFMYHFTLSPHCILFCLLLSPRCIRLFLLLSTCWNQFLHGLT